jgi:hypothetical protein
MGMEAPGGIDNSRSPKIEDPAYVHAFNYMHKYGMNLLANNLNRMSVEDLNQLGGDLGGWVTPDTEDEEKAIAALMIYQDILDEIKKAPGGLYSMSEELGKRKIAAINNFKIKAGI